MPGVVSEEVGLVSRADFKIEIARDENQIALAVTTCPVNHVRCKGATPRGAEGISVCAHDHDFG